MNLSDAAAFSATYADWKLVKTRSVVQIVFEAPIEREAEVYAVLGGMPRAAEERWFAIARLNIKGTSGEAVPSPTTVSERTLHFATEGTAGGGSSPETTRPRNPLSTRAAILCEDPQFRLFLERWPSTNRAMPTGSHVNNANEAAMVVRWFCRVESRSHIVPGSDAADRWENLYSQFIVWKNADRYVEAPRIQQNHQA